MGPNLFPQLNKYAGIGDRLDLMQFGLRLNERKDKEAEEGLALEFAVAANYRVARCFPKSDSESEDIQKLVFMDVGA